MLRRILNFIFPQGPYGYDQLTEGVWADQYTDTDLQQSIRDRYQQRWQPQSTPITDPQLFDPVEPPPGWRYDPYYETWIQLR